MAMLTEHADETLELVDADGAVIGTALRSDVYARGVKNFRLAEVVVRDSSGKILMLKRSEKAAQLPGLWETIGEHIHPGESDVDAARRALREEIGLDVPSLQFSFLGYTTPAEGAVGYCAVFLATVDEPPQLMESHSEAKWLTREEISTLLREQKQEIRSNVLLIFGRFSKEIFSAGIV